MMFVYTIFIFVLLAFSHISLGENALKIENLKNDTSDEAADIVNFDTAKLMIDEGIDYAMKSVFVPLPAKAIVVIGRV